LLLKLLYVNFNTEKCGGYFRTEQGGLWGFLSKNQGGDGGGVVEKAVENVYNYFVNNVTKPFYVKYVSSAGGNVNKNNLTASFPAFKINRMILWENGELLYNQ